MRYIIRLTESELYRFIGDITSQLLSEANKSDNSLTQGALDRLVGKKPVIQNQDAVKGKIENGTYGVRKEKSKKPEGEVNTDVETEEPYDPDNFGDNVINVDRDDFGGFPMEMLKGEDGEYDPIMVRKALMYRNGYKEDISSELKKKKGERKGSQFSVDDEKNGSIVNQLNSEEEPEEEYISSQEFKDLFYKLVELELDVDKNEINQRNYCILLDFLNNVDPKDLAEKYGISDYHSIYHIIDKTIDKLRNSPEFKERVNQILNGGYDVNRTKTNANRLTATGDEIDSPTKKFTDDYSQLVRGVFKRLNGYDLNGDIDTSDGIPLKDNDFAVWYINRYVKDYDRMYPTAKLDIINKIKNMYMTSKFFNKWLKKEE